MNADAGSGTSIAAAPTYAALDLGTNNCRLLVAAAAGEGFRVVDSFSRVVRLGEGLHATGALGDAAMERALAALQACASRLARRPVRGVRAIATEACRRAANGPAFLARVREQTGLSFTVISPREEAELALESCVPLLQTADSGFAGGRALLFDIGGGSTELAWVRLGRADAAGIIPRPELIGYASLPVGVVTLAEQWGEAAFTPDGFESIVTDVTTRLLPFERVHCIAREARGGDVRLLGTSGTVTTLAGVALRLSRYRRPLVDGAVLTSAAAAGALADLRALGRTGLSTHPCVGPDRVDLVLPGCAIYAAIARLWPVPRLTVADRGLREGMLLRMIVADRARPGRADQGERRMRRAEPGWPPASRGTG